MNDVENVLFKVTLHNIDNTRQKHRAIDHKAISLITISGILAGFVISFGSPSNAISSFIQYITTIAFIATILVTVPVLAPRKLDELSTLDYLNLEDDDDEVTVSEIIKTTAEYEDDQQNICNDKAKQLWASVRALGVSICILFAYVYVSLIPI
ncbi:MAG: hypothetical protein ACXQTE_01395 [Methanosarcinaceae archaeon]